MIEDLITSTTHGTFSRSAIYLPPGEGAEPVEVSVIVDLSVETFDAYGNITRTDAADFLLSEVSPGRDGLLYGVEGHDGKSWRLGDRLEDDGHIRRMMMREDDSVNPLQFGLQGAIG